MATRVEKTFPAERICNYKGSFAHLLSVNISGDSAPLQLGSKAEAIRADLGTLLSAAQAGDD